MRIEYGLPNTERTEIAEWRELLPTGTNRSQQWFVMPDGSKVGNPQAEHFLAAGWVLKVVPEYNSAVERLITDSYTIGVDTATQSKVGLTSEEISDGYNNKRMELLRTAYLLADQKQSSATVDYSPAETIRWAGWVMASLVAKAADDDIAGSGDWTFLKMLECGEVVDCSGCDGLACQAYGNSILAKHALLEAYSDAVVLARNNHKKAIVATPDAALANYDGQQFWPEVLDIDSVLYSTL